MLSYVQTEADITKRAGVHNWFEPRLHSILKFPNRCIDRLIRIIDYRLKFEIIFYCICDRNARYIRYPRDHTSYEVATYMIGKIEMRFD